VNQEGVGCDAYGYRRDGKAAEPVTAHVFVDETKERGFYVAAAAARRAG
jgi:hypothetical protein